MAKRDQPSSATSFRLSPANREVVDRLRVLLYESDPSSGMPSATDVYLALLAYAEERLRRSPRQFQRDLAAIRFRL